jgi:peptidoglycan/LPS O-acetylase OafA/YrhL
VFGQYLVRCKDKEQFYRLALAVSVLALILSVVGLIIGLGVDMGLTDDYVYYHQDTLINVIYISFAVFWMCGLFYITKVLPKAVGKTIGRWSRNVTDIYIIHWIMIGWIAIAVGRHGLDLALYALLFIVIFVVSDVLALWYNRRKRLKAQEAVPRPSHT